MSNAWTTISDWAAFITALSAIVGLILQNRLTKFTVSADLLVRLDDKFDEATMIRRRKMAARALLSRNNPGAIKGILYFFEEIGILVQKGALDPDLVYNEFSYWAISYWMASREYIEEIQKG